MCKHNFDFVMFVFFHSLFVLQLMPEVSKEQICDFTSFTAKNQHNWYGEIGMVVQMAL